MVLGKLDGRGYDIANTRLIHKRICQAASRLLKRDFLQSSFHYKFQYVTKLPDRDFKFLENCMDWKTLWSESTIYTGVNA